MSAAATAVAVKDFVTVVSVGGSCSGVGSVQQQHHQQLHHPQQQPSEDSFVTVLAIGQDSETPAADEAVAEEVLVYRLPGERLGFGLRFDGVDTSCNRLFVQSCADGSPASRTRASWGPLSAGDEIVLINGLPVNRLSRDDCVRCLKESGLVVKLHMVDGRLIVKAPPPVPPRKQRKPEPPPIPGPPIASSAVYTDAVERFVYHGESESDDTNSSVSTVVSKCQIGTPYAGVGGGDGSNGQNDDDAVLDRVLEPFMQLEREFSSSAAVGDDMGLYEKLVAVAEEDRSLPPKPLPRKEVRPAKKKPPPPPPPLSPSPALTAPPPPPPYRPPPRLVDFVHKDDAALTAANDDGEGDDVFANDDSISGPSADNNVIAEQDNSPETEDGQESSKATSKRAANLTAPESKTPESSCVGNGGERPAVMKSSYPVPDCSGPDTETDSDGSRNAAVVTVTAVTTKRPSSSGGSNRTDEVCNRSVRDKIAMFSQATGGGGGTEKKDSVSSSSAYSTATGSPDSSPAASPRAAAYRCGTLPRRDLPSPPPPHYQQQWPQRGPGATTSVRPLEMQAPADPRRRSLSLVEQQPYSKYFNSMNSYAEMGRSSLNALIDQRRRSMSKLRGLVIPEKAPSGGDLSRTDGGAVDDDPAVAIPDLPLVIKASATADEDEATAAVLCPPTKTYVNGPPPVTGTAIRRANPVQTAVARHTAFVSPAVQPEQRRPSPAARVQPQQPRRPSSASSSPSSPSSSSSASSSSSSLNSSREELRHIHDERPQSPTESKGAFKADSDEDSALSSSRSSTSLQQYSPASSPPPPPPPSTRPPPLQNAAVEVGKRVLKAESVEAINRKNVLCSARTSSGKPEPLLFGGQINVAQKTEQQQLHSVDGPAPKSAKTAPPAAFAVGTAGGGAANRYSHIRMSSVDSTTSDDSSMQYAVNAEPFGSISSIASSTSLISQQELQQLIDDANLSLEENGCGGGAAGAGLTSASSVHVPVEVMVVILHRDMATSSAGITLAGGADYETKEITVYKVLAGSPADKDGRIRKGDRILSINGKSMKGITHRESLAILKAPRSEVVLVISRCKTDATVESIGPVQSRDLVNSAENDMIANRVFGHLTKVTLSKDGSGLGFSLEGGKNSPIGDQPLTVKKIFTGGSAEQCGQILAGDELVSVNDINVTGMSRTEAWNLMKRLVNGTVTLGIRHRV